MTYQSSRYDTASRRRLQQRVTLETTSRHGLPTPAELKSALEYLKKGTLQRYAQVLLSTNEEIFLP